MYSLLQFKPTVECITRKHFQIAGNAHLLSNLHPGNYSLRLRASSLAGVGEYTSFKYFSIEVTIHKVAILRLLLSLAACIAINR